MSVYRTIGPLVLIKFQIIAHSSDPKLLFEYWVPAHRLFDSRLTLEGTKTLLNCCKTLG